MPSAEKQDSANRPMQWSLKLGEVAGIGIYVHWTFSLLLIWIAMIHLGNDGSWLPVLRGVVLILAVFTCVVLHELGHALTARRFHIQTRDITLLPIGGVARLEKMPEDPKQELLVALAGPAVNVVIAAVLLGVLVIMGGLAPLQKAFSVTGPFLLQLMVINIILVVFNVLPAFPMDGGRALRAILAMRMDYVSATEAAARAGQGMAILFGIIGIMTMHWVLLFIAIFVYLGAQAEAHMVQVRFAVRNVPVTSAMVTDFQVLSEHDTLDVAVQALLAGSQQDFPVMDGDRLVGVLRRQDLITTLAEKGKMTPVSEIMQRDCRTIDETAMLEDVIEPMQAGPCPMLPVMRGDQLVGILTLENVGEWLMIRSALRQRAQQQQA